MRQSIPVPADDEKNPMPGLRGGGESLEDVLDTAELIEKIEGVEEVEKMDALLSLAITGGDDSWI